MVSDVQQQKTKKTPYTLSIHTFYLSFFSYLSVFRVFLKYFSEKIQTR
jgi:hypothetical protein